MKELLQTMVETREELIAELKKEFDYHTKKANEAQLKLESLWCENEADKRRIESLKTINN